MSTQQLKAKAAWNMARFKSENWMSARQALDIAVKLEPNDPIANRDAVRAKPVEAGRATT